MYIIIKNEILLIINKYKYNFNNSLLIIVNIILKNIISIRSHDCFTCYTYLYFYNNSSNSKTFFTLEINQYYKRNKI